MDWVLNLFSKNTETIVQPITGGNLPHVVWIHGANATSRSFNFIRSHLPEIECTLVEYSSSNSFYDNLENMIDQIKNTGPVFLIGHSLGGMYALHLTKHVDTIGGVSISTPFRGSRTADWARFMAPSHQLFKDVGRYSKPILEAEKIYPGVNWTQIVTTAGNVPWHDGQNDGVVTIASMEHLSDRMKLEYVPVNHYEVMCCLDTVNIISQNIVL